MNEATLPREWLEKLAEKLLTPEERDAIEGSGSFEALMDKLRQRLAEQKGRHQGGNKWIGTAGTSPFGTYGYNPEGVRIGQDESRHRRAVKVWDKREFRDFDDTVELGTRNIKVALKRLRQWARHGAAEELDLPGTIRATADHGYIDVQTRPERRNAVKVLLFLDVGGSMDDHTRLVDELFSAARAEFKHMQHFYFHNCLYEGIWTDNRRRWDAQTPTWDVLHRFGHVDPDGIRGRFARGEVVAADGTAVRLLAETDQDVDALLAAVRTEAGVDLAAAAEADAQTAEFLSELRLVKDAWEVERMRASVAATIAGFEDVVRALPRAVGHDRGERVVEGAFFARARLEGNDLGYDTIAASGNNATILHWIRNTGAVRPGELLLLDAGVEDDSLYTADITRTLPVSGTFTDVQRRIYQAVLDAADAAFAIVRPGIRFRELHAEAMRVLVDRLDGWGLLPVSAEVALSDEGQHHRRWMPHGTSHHLGLDVHDCAQAKRELYLDGVLEPGMVFTIEPGLYFKEEDLAVPEEYRGIGVRIEDDILVTEDGAENLSAALPRTPDEIEAWMARLQA